VRGLTPRWVTSWHEIGNAEKAEGGVWLDDSTWQKQQAGDTYSYGYILAPSVPGRTARRACRYAAALQLTVERYTLNKYGHEPTYEPPVRYDVRKTLAVCGRGGNLRF
jgi:hypothetical protein